MNEYLAKLLQEILGTILLNLQLLLTNANHAFPAMPDGRDGSSIAFL